MIEPPRLVVRTLTAAFVTVAAILSIVFIVLMVDARGRVRAAEIEKLRVAERVFAELELRRQEDQLAAVAALAENPTLKAALDTYFTESRFAALAGDQEASLRATVALEAGKLARLTHADALAVLDADRRVFVSAGPLADRWPQDQAVDLAIDAPAFHGIVWLPRGAFRASGATLRLVDRTIGALVLGISLDMEYARELSTLANADVVITIGGAPVATTLPAGVAKALAADPPADTAETMTLDGEEYAVRRVVESGRARIYTLASIGAAARAETRDALTALAAIAFGAFVLAGVGSFWLARTLSTPIDRLSRDIAMMTTARDLVRVLPPTGTSRELDALARAFNELVQSLSAAEAETQSAYVGAIRALAAALDARDPYTAGHSDRVSHLAVLMGTVMRLTDAEVEVLRLGALLHDIGKIGISDEVLRKAGPLTAGEYEQLKLHPVLGARILRRVPFLEPHLPIVELHHERPDGRGYPFGLRGGEIPMAARIVHVADAFDAMTSARAYRPARGAIEALAELRRHAGTQFDEASVEALAAVLPQVVSTARPGVPEPIRELVV